LETGISPLPGINYGSDYILVGVRVIYTRTLFQSVLDIGIRLVHGSPSGSSPARAPEEKDL